jgi:hypothetical protein
MRHQFPLFLLHLSALLMVFIAVHHALNGDDLACAVTLGCAAVTALLSLIWELK